jgi:hypothetical protein
MERRIGAILRQARAKREIDLTDVEAATRIRLKYLRAIEAEEWDALPESVYARGFIRAYAAFLGLDGERIAEEYRREVEGEVARLPADAGAAPRQDARARRDRRRRVPPAWPVVAGVLAMAALALAVLPLDEDGESGTTTQRPAPRPAPVRAKTPKPPPKPAPAGVSVRLVAGAEVWVCVLDESGQPLVDGQILAAGAAEGPFRSGSFTVSFGNGEVTMAIDGKQAEIPRTASPIGYSIDAAGRLAELSEAERPTCE